MQNTNCSTEPELTTEEFIRLFDFATDGQFRPSNSESERIDNLSNEELVQELSN